MADSVASTMTGPSHDDDLARRDGALPGLEVVLDGERFAALLRAGLPELGVRAARPTYVRYKPGTSCLVDYQLQLADRAVGAYVRLERLPSFGKVAKYARRATDVGAIGGGAILLPGIAAALYPFPTDRQVRALPALVDPVRRREMLAHVLPDTPELWDVSMVPLRRKPERRFVAQLRGDEGPKALVKAFADDFVAADRASTLLGGTGRPRTARRLGSSDSYGVVVTEWLPGRTLSEELAHHRASSAHVAHAGAALADLHACARVDLRVSGHDVEVERLHASAAMLGHLLPTLNHDVHDLAQRIADRLPRDRPRTLCHGDFSADQVLVDGDRVALLDLDEAVVGHAAKDLGSFVAALERDVVHETLSRPVAEAARSELLTGYAADREDEFNDAVRIWTAGALVHLAPESFRLRDPAWPDHARALIYRARTLATAAEPSALTALPATDERCSGNGRIL